MGWDVRAKTKPVARVIKEVGGRHGIFKRIV